MVGNGCVDRLIFYLSNTKFYIKNKNFIFKIQNFVLEWQKYWLMLFVTIITIPTWKDK